MNLVAILALGIALATHADASSTRWVSPDFFIREISRPSEWEAPPADCRAHIAKIVCVVDPVSEMDKLGEDRPCLPGAERYIAPFQELHDRFPPALQKMFCSLSHIYIEKKFFGTAYAWMNEDKQGIWRAGTGIRQSVLDENLRLAGWASWKEQLSFGGKTDSYALTPGLPTVSTSPPQANDFLYFVIAHEFGHIFDFVNKLNTCTEKPSEPGKECPVTPGSWGALSWETTHKPKRQNDFEKRKDLCFYWCDGKALKQTDVGPVYSALYPETEFLSLYTTTQVWDDLADSLAYYLVDKHLGSSYFVETADGTKLDTMTKLHSAKFAAKKAYLERFLNSGSIKYPVAK